MLVEGVGLRGLRPPLTTLDCGNSGSTMRMLAGILAGQGFVSTLTGDESLRSRPMKRIIAPLELMGASMESEDGRPPLVIHGCEELKPINYELPMASAQVKSCVLLAGLYATGRTQVVEKSGATRDHTERMLSWMGVPVEIKDELQDGVRALVAGVAGPGRLVARDLSIPADISSAAFFIAAAGLLRGSDLEIPSVGVNPTRALFLKVMRDLDVNVFVANVSDESNEPRGDVYIRSRNSRGPRERVVINGAQIPQLIDELPLLGVVGSQVRGGIEIRDAAELRVKETDRISATVTNLRAMGAEVEEYEDGLGVAGPVRLQGARLDSFGDHRIAMAFTIAGLLADGETEMAGAECVAISFPEFFELLESVVER